MHSDEEGEFLGEADDASFEQRSSGGESIGGNLIDDLEGEANDEQSVPVTRSDEAEEEDDHDHEADASPNLSFSHQSEDFQDDIFHTPHPPTNGHATAHRGSMTEPAQRPSAHRRSRSVPDGVSRPQSAQGAQSEVESVRSHGPRLSHSWQKPDSTPRHEDHSSLAHSSHGRRPVCVAARVRPQLFTELSRGDAQIVRVNGEKLIVANPDAFLADPSLITAFASAAALDNYQFDDWVKLFRFDYCFWTPPHDTSDFEELNQTQSDIFETIGQRLVEDALNGRHASCFAYGAALTGKTYTIFGDINNVEVNMDDNLEFNDHTGLALRVFATVIERLSPEYPDPALEPDAEAPFTLSFLLIHDHSIRDLLNLDTEPSLLKVRTNRTGATYISELTKEPISTPAQLLNVLRIGVENRATCESTFGIEPSRSHTIVTLEFQAHNKRNVQMHMVDLAACNKVVDRQSPAKGVATSTALVNRSLSNLGTLLTVLGKRAASGTTHRDTTLTWLLKGALSSSASCALIATLSPSQHEYALACATLTYAKNVMNVKDPSGRALTLTEEDTLDPDLTRALASDFEHLKEQLTKSRESQRMYLEQSIADPQQRMAKMEQRIAKEAPVRQQVAPIIFAGKRYVEMIDEESQCNLAVDTRQTVSDLENTITDLEAALAVARTDKEFAEIELKQERERNRGNSKDVSEEMYREMRELKEKNKALEQHKERLIDALQQIHAERNQLEAELIRDRQAHEAREKLNRDTINDLTNKCAQLERQVQDLKSEIARLQAENKMLKDQVDELRRQLLNAQNANQTGGREREQEIERLKARIAELENQLRQLEAQCAVLKQELDQARAEAAELPAKNSEIIRLRKEIDALNGDAQREIARLRSELAEAYQKIRQLQDELGSEKSQTANSLRRLEQRQGALSRLESEGEGWLRLQTALQNLLEREGAAMSSEVEDVRRLSDMLADARRKTEELQTIRGDLQRERQEHEQTRVQLASLRTQFPGQPIGDPSVLAHLGHLQQESKQQQILLQKYRAELVLAKEEAESYAARAREYHKLARDRAEIIRSTRREPSAPNVNVEEFQHKIHTLQSTKETLVHDNERLRLEATQAQEAAKRAQQHFQQYKETKDRELTAIWLAVHKLDMMDALKTATLETVKADRDNAMQESKLLSKELQQINAANFDLQRELHGVDSNLLAIADAEGIYVDDLRVRTPVSTGRRTPNSRSQLLAARDAPTTPRAASPMLRADPRVLSSANSKRYPSRSRAHPRTPQELDQYEARPVEYVDEYARPAENGQRRGSFRKPTTPV